MADPNDQVHRSSNFAPHGQFTTLCSGAGIRKSPLPQFASAFLLDSERKIEATVCRPPSLRLETDRACSENERPFQHCPIQQTAFHRLSVATQAAYRRRT